MKALEKCYKNMTLTLVCDLRGHRSGLKWSQKVNITQGGHVHSFDITNVIFCVPLIYNTLVCEKRNFGRRPGGAECDSHNRFMKVVRYSHVAYQMEALKKCYKNMILILVWDLRGHYDYNDLKWPQKLHKVFTSQQGEKFSLKKVADQLLDLILMHFSKAFIWYETWIYLTTLKKSHCRGGGTLCPTP